jgi:hypothetical protein
MLMMKASDPVVDKEAEQEQMEQVSKQMEDAIVKERLQATKSNKGWNASNEKARAPNDVIEPPSKSQGMNNIEKEQIKLLEQEVSSLPGRSEKLQSGNNLDNKMSMAEKVTGKDGVVDKVLDSMTKTKQALKETFPAVHDFGHEIKQTAKASMDDMKEMAKASATSSNSNTSDPNTKHDTKVTQAGDPQVPKPKSKQFSESKENSSLF